MTWDGTGVDPWLPARLDAILNLAEAERTIWQVVWAALTAWLAAVLAAVLRGGRPDPAAVWALQPDWATAVDGVVDGPVLAVMGEAYITLFGAGYDHGQRRAVTAHLDEVRSRLAGVPDDVYALIVAEVSDGAHRGESTRQLADRVDQLLSVTGSERWRNRAATIARTEAVAALSASRHDAAAAWSDETGLRLERVWVSTLDTQVRPSHAEADGQRQPLDEPFTVGGFSLLFPGDPLAPAHETVNCRCHAIYTAPGSRVDLFANPRGAP